MSDFVAEIKPKSFASQGYSSFRGKDDFVAEIRSRSSDVKPTAGLGVSHDNSDSDMYLEKMLSDRNFSREALTRLLEGSLVTLVETLLTGRNISKIGGTLCICFYGNESPVVVNLQKSFPEKQISKRPADLESCLNVKIKARDTPTLSLSCGSSVASCSPAYKFDRDPCHSPTETDHSTQACSGSLDDSVDPCHSPTETDRSTQACSGSLDNSVSFVSTSVLNSHPQSPEHNTISSTTMDTTLSSITHEVSSASSSPKPEVEAHEGQLGYTENDSPMNSDVESGYLSNEKEDSSQASDNCIDEVSRVYEKPLNGFNEYFCSGFDATGTQYMSVESPASDDVTSKLDPDSCGSSGEGSDEMDEDADEDCERRLVIDENAVNNLKTAKIDEKLKELGQNDNCCSPSEIMSVGNVLMNANPKQQHLDEEEEEGSTTFECEDVESAVCSDVTDTNTYVELPGNSRFSWDHVSGIPHPQSIVSKHPAGLLCKQCLHVLPDSAAVSLHVQAEHNLHLCNYCCRAFTAKNNLKRHVRRHTGQKPYKCNHCPQSFFRRDDLKGHMIRHEHSKPFRCSLCQKGYTDRACVKNHMAKEHRSRLMHVCPQCGESFDCEEAFTIHKRGHPELEQFACTTCSFIGTNNLMTRKHNLLHSHKLFSCKPCNAHFADPFDYTNHIRKHKHMDSFAQYVCCFCDIILGTYEQYVRHEYSHAQCKIHSCTICRKQFRNKVLLQDHIMTHQQTDELGAGQHLSELEITKRSHHVHWEEPEVEQKHFLHTAVNIQPRSVELARQRSSCGVEETSAGLVTQTRDDECYGQLLDLSMKKPSSPTFASDSHNSGQNQTKNYNTSIRATGTSVNDGSRNGASSSDPANLSRECGLSASGFGPNQLMKAVAPEEDAYKPVFNNLMNITRNSDLGLYRSHFSPVSEAEPTQFLDITGSYAFSELPFTGGQRRAERKHNISGDSTATSDRKPCRRVAGNRYAGKPPPLFSPYSREKMADLAAKFMVARGNKLVGEKGRVKLIVAESEGEKKTGGIREQSIAQKQQPAMMMAPEASPVRTEGTYRNALLDLTGQAQQDRDNVVREYSNLETTLRCHIPTVVKSEPLIDQDENADCPLDFRYRTLKADDADTRSSVGGSHSCDICKEMFGTFLELEDHSVEVHKRYLCEHCKKGFTARPNRDRHVRYHTGERPYKCDLCDLAFFRGDDLKYHRTTRHPTAQPFVCPRCSANFTWGRDLERHIRHSKCKV